MKRLVELGISEEDARGVYAATLRAIASQLEAGRNGNEIYQAVAGQKSFTEGLAQLMDEQGYFRFLAECVEITVQKCRRG